MRWILCASHCASRLDNTGEEFRLSARSVILMTRARQRPRSTVSRFDEIGSMTKRTNGGGEVCSEVAVAVDVAVVVIVITICDVAVVVSW